MIEQWLPADTVDSCKLSCSNATTCGVSEWWNTRILPYAGMTLKGWVWYRAFGICPLLLPAKSYRPYVILCQYNGFVTEILC